LQEIVANLQTATQNCLELVEALLAGEETLACEHCTCRKSLELAVWTDAKQIDPARKKELAVLFQ
jgi:hypothetical protein